MTYLSVFLRFIFLKFTNFKGPMGTLLLYHISKHKLTTELSGVSVCSSDLLLKVSEKGSK